MDKVRFGVVGIGNMGSSHCKWLNDGKSVKNGVLTAACDINPEKIENIKKQLTDASAVTFFDDAEKMFGSGLIDVAIIAVPHYDHPGLVIKALDAGLNVICEKPAGVYTKQVKEMNERAAKSDKIFALMFNQRTRPIFRKMREMVKEGAVGNIKRLNWIITDWYRSQSYYDSGSWRATWAGEGGGVLFNQAPHNIDLFQWIPGMMPSKVRAFCHFGKWHDIEVEDDVTAYFEYPNGATGVFITTTADAPGSNRFEIVGDGGELIFDDDKLVYKKLKQNEREFNRTWTKGFGSPEWEKIDVEVEDDGVEQHVRVINNVADAVLGIAPQFIDGKEGIKGVELADAMLLSTWLDKTVDLPFDDDLYFEELKKRIATSRLKTAKETVLDTAGSYGEKK